MSELRLLYTKDHIFSNSLFARSHICCRTKDQRDSPRLHNFVRLTCSMTSPCCALKEQQYCNAVATSSWICSSCCEHHKHRLPTNLCADGYHISSEPQSSCLCGKALYYVLLISFCMHCQAMTHQLLRLILLCINFATGVIF